MKKLVFGLIAMVVFGFVGYAQGFKEQYFTYKKSVASFYTKFDLFNKSINIEIDDENIFKSEESFKKWLDENIEKTKFKDIKEALDDYNELVSMLAETTKNNIDFINQINDNKKEFLNLLKLYPLNGVPINSIVIPQNTTQSFPCVSECINNAVECSNNADAAFSDAMIISGIAFASGNAIGGAAAAWGGYRAHSRAIKRCVRTLNLCASECN